MAKQILSEEEVQDIQEKIIDHMKPIEKESSEFKLNGKEYLILPSDIIDKMKGISDETRRLTEQAIIKKVEKKIDNFYEANKGLTSWHLKLRELKESMFIKKEVKNV